MIADPVEVRRYVDRVTARAVAEIQPVRLGYEWSFTWTPLPRNPWAWEVYKPSGRLHGRARDAKGAKRAIWRALGARGRKACPCPTY